MFTTAATATITTTAKMAAKNPRMRLSVASFTRVSFSAIILSAIRVLVRRVRLDHDQGEILPHAPVVVGELRGGGPLELEAVGNFFGDLPDRLAAALEGREIPAVVEIEVGLVLGHVAHGVADIRACEFNLDATRLQAA